jgi:TIR domain
MDTVSTAWGEEWPSALEKAISAADVVIVVIGPGWISAQGDWGRRRIDQPDDWVRREIELALGSGKPTLPVLVGDTAMPRPRHCRRRSRRWRRGRRSGSATKTGASTSKTCSGD